MDYQSIQKVNSEISTIDLKGKSYAMVPERVNAFRKLFPEGFISTEIISHDGTTILMQAKAGYYEKGVPVILGTGFAQEVKGKGLVNGTSYVENAETSAVGRALGFIGLGINGGGICSAEELVNAITAQNQMQEQPRIQRQEPTKATVELANKLPEQPKKEEKKIEPTEVQRYLLNAMKELREARKITAAENNKLFKKRKEVLVEKELVPGKPLEEYTLDEAKKLVNLMYTKFDPEGTEIKE